MLRVDIMVMFVGNFFLIKHQKPIARLVFEAVDF